MRKLKLQVQMSLDGFVAGPNGELDWMVSDSDSSVSEKIIDPADSCDIILLGRKMTPGFIDYWENIFDNKPEDREHPLAQRMVTMRKIVFSRTQKTMKGRNLEVENGDLADQVKQLKNQAGKDMIVYGGASFAGALISLNLIDEYYIFRNPVAIGKGLPLFREQKLLKLDSSTALKNGTVLNKYFPA